MIVTLKRLKRENACYSQRVLFEKRFGESVTLTRKIIEKHIDEFERYWFMNHFMSVKQIEKFWQALNASGAEEEFAQAQRELCGDYESESAEAVKQEKQLKKALRKYHKQVSKYLADALELP